MPRWNRLCISLGKHSTGQAQKLSKKERFSKVYPDYPVMASVTKRVAPSRLIRCFLIFFIMFYTPFKSQAITSAWNKGSMSSRAMFRPASKAFDSRTVTYSTSKASTITRLYDVLSSSRFVSRQILPVLIESRRPIILTPRTSGAIMFVWKDEEGLSGIWGEL